MEKRNVGMFEPAKQSQILHRDYKKLPPSIKNRRD